MAIQKVTNSLIFALAADTKPSTYANNTLCYEQDTGSMYRSTSGSWAIYSGASKTETLTNKTVNATNNTITDTSTAAGDILKSNGTKFVRMARGTGLQVLRTNSGATDLEYASLNSENTGKAVASGNASATVFNIAHSLGSIPTVAMANCSSLTTAYTYTTDTTNIIVTFATAPPTGTNNVIIYWRAVA